MANWCSNRFVIHGEKGLLLKFYMDMSAAISEHPNFPRVENDWDRDWIGNLFLEAGYPQNVVEDGNQIQCRGSVTGLEFEKDHVVLDMETAWSPNDESMQMMLDEKYPGLEMVFMAEEPGNCLFINTDETGKYLPDKYVIDYQDKTGDCDMIYYDIHQEEEFVRKISELTGKDWLNAAEILGHAAEVQDAFNEYNPGDGCYLSVNEFTPY